MDEFFFIKFNKNWNFCTNLKLRSSSMEIAHFVYSNVSVSYNVVLMMSVRFFEAYRRLLTKKRLLAAEGYQKTQRAVRGNLWYRWTLLGYPINFGSATFPRGRTRTDKRTDGRTDERTNKLTNGRTDG